MANVFGVNAQVGFILKAPESNGFKANSNIAMVQNWSLQYQQNVTPLYECGSAKISFAVKAAAGQLTIARIVTKDSSSITDLFGNVCDAAKNNIQIAAGGACDSGGTGGTLSLKGVVPQSVGYSGQAQNAYVEEQISVVFASLEMGGKKPAAKKK